LGLLHDMLCLSYVSKVLFHFLLLYSFGFVRNLHFSFDVLFLNIRFQTSSTNCSLYSARSLLAFSVMLHTFAYTPLCLLPLQFSRCAPLRYRALSLFLFLSRLSYTHTRTHGLLGGNGSGDGGNFPMRFLLCLSFCDSVLCPHSLRTT